jgi:hypothetical protein
MFRSHPPAPAAGTAPEQVDSGAIGDADDIATARQAKYVAFLHRHPFATDAYELGFLPGIREDYSFQINDLANVETPVLMIDNDFRDPDPERYVACIQKLAHPPWVCVLGDAATPEQAHEYTRLARELADDFPTPELVIVPKCREAIKIIDDQFVLGYAMGYSDVQAQDFSDVSDWRGRRIHLLGASPPKQFATIQRLTQPTLSGEPPADIVGLDWNGPQRVAYLGEYWSADGWQRADHLSVRTTVRRSLREMRAFWQKRGVWPAETPIEHIGPPVREPDDPVFAASGEAIREREALENAVIVDYENGATLAYRSGTERAHVEYRAGLIQK